MWGAWVAAARVVCCLLAPVRVAAAAALLLLLPLRLLLPLIESRAAGQQVVAKRATLSKEIEKEACHANRWKKRCWSYSSRRCLGHWGSPRDQLASAAVALGGNHDQIHHRHGPVLLGNGLCLRLALRFRHGLHTRHPAHPAARTAGFAPACLWIV